MLSPDIYQKIVTDFKLESQSHLREIRKIIKALPCYLNQHEKLESLFRANFALQGGLGILGYGNLIPNFIDNICMYLKKNPQFVDDFIVFMLLEMIEILTLIIQGIKPTITPDENQYFTQLKAKSDSLRKKLEIYLKQKDKYYQMSFSSEI
jgi:hypothetical protein